MRWISDIAEWLRRFGKGLIEVLADLFGIFVLVAIAGTVTFVLDIMFIPIEQLATNLNDLFEQQRCELINICR